jgi:tRNA U34 5-carboxymethylaminomethyl modifying enzyme MnmG/GidA
MNHEFDVDVISGGHAGTEITWAAVRWPRCHVRLYSVRFSFKWSLSWWMSRRRIQLLMQSSSL